MRSGPGLRLAGHPGFDYHEPVSQETQQTVESFWQLFLASRQGGAGTPPSTYTSWSFCDNEESANELGALVQQGIKTATCSLVWGYEAEGEPMPAAGDLSVITNWAGDPLCIIETTEVVIRRFNEVDEQFARDEGEGDRSLSFWREAHWGFFSRECAAIRREPAETMPVLCERFRVVFPGTGTGGNDVV